MYIEPIIYISYFYEDEWMTISCLQHIHFIGAPMFSKEKMISPSLSIKKLFEKTVLIRAGYKFESLQISFLVLLN